MGVKQPVVVGSRIVTFWESVADDIRYGSTRDLGEILRRLHELRVPKQLRLPELTPFEAARFRIDVVPIDDDARQYLGRSCDEMEADYGRLQFELPPVVLHGDANVGNLILDRYDRALLSDLDSFCWAC